MQTATPQHLLSQRVLNWLINKWKEFRCPFASALIFGLLAHTYAFTNKLPNLDDLGCLFNKGTTYQSGRWGLCILELVFPNVSMPWIYGVITIILLAVSVCIMATVLSIRRRWVQVLAAGFLITFPSLTATFSYMFTSSSYGVAFLMAVLSVWLVQRKAPQYWLIAVGCLIFSLSIYQAYVAITASLLVLVLIHRLLDGAEPTCVLRSGIAYILFLILSLGIYYAGTQLLLKLAHKEFCAYASDSITFDLRAIPARIVMAYQYFLRSFTLRASGLIPSRISQLLHLPLLACAAFILVRQFMVMWKKPVSALLFAALIVIFPLAVDCMYLFTSPKSIHTLVLYSFSTVYLLVLMLWEHMLDDLTVNPQSFSVASRLSLDAIALVSSLIIMVNIFVANSAYLSMHLRYENTYAFYTSLVADLKASPDFTEGTKLAIIGTWDSPDFYADHFSSVTSLTGVTTLSPDVYSKHFFITYYLGMSIPLTSDAENEQLAATREFAEMPVYPYYGSMRKIGDNIVVRLS